MNILLFGDICPTNKNEDKFAKGQINELFGDVLNIIKKSDLAIANLECPLTENVRKAIKSGPNLKSKPSSINAIKDAKFDVLSIANNHIMDFGETGLRDTIKACKEAGIDYVGADINAIKAQQYLIKHLHDKKIGIMAFADNELNIAYGDNAGANGIDLLYSFEEINKAKKQCDYLIIIYHSGLEHYEYPSPELQRRCRKMVEMGADLVTCQHSHIIGCNEEYLNGTIVYGQGNFLFSTYNESTEWNTGLIISLDFDNNKNILKYIPIETTKEGNVILLNKERSRFIMNDFFERSTKIADLNFLQAKHDEYCKKKECVYWGILMGYPRLIYVINRLLNNLLTRIFVRKNKAIVIENIIQCETHNEVLRKVINNYYK